MSAFFVFLLPIGLAVYFAVWAEWRLRDRIEDALLCDAAALACAFGLTSAYILSVTILTGDFGPDLLALAAWRAIKITAFLMLAWGPVALFMIAVRPWPKEGEE